MPYLRGTGGAVVAPSKGQRLPTNNAVINTIAAVMLLLLFVFIIVIITVLSLFLFLLIVVVLLL